MKSRLFCQRTKEFIVQQRAAARKFSQEFISGKPGVEAVFCAGSVGRGDCEQGQYGYTIDICVIISSDSIDELFDSLETKREGLILNVFHNGFTFAIQTIPKDFMYPYNPENPTKYYNVQESILLYDKDGLAAELQNLKMPEKEWKLQMSICYFQAIYHMNNYRIEKWLRRQEYRQCHLNLNVSFNYILKLIYLANLSFVPRDDYLFYLLDGQPWLPENAEENLEGSILIKEMSLSDILRRRRHLVFLLTAIRDRIDIQKICPFAHLDDFEKVAEKFNDSELTSQ